MSRLPHEIRGRHKGEGELCYNHSAPRESADTLSLSALPLERLFPTRRRIASPHCINTPMVTQDNPIPAARKQAGSRIVTVAITLGREYDSTNAPIPMAEVRRRIRAIKGRKAIPLTLAISIAFTVATHVRQVRATRHTRRRSLQHPRAQKRIELARRMAIPLADRLISHALKTRAELVRTHYRETSSRIGGERTIDIPVGEEPQASGVSKTVWHNTQNWRGTNSHLSVAFSPTWFTDVKLAGLSVIRGLVTTHAKQIEDDLWEAAWVQQGTGFTLKVGRGFIARSADGTTLSHGSNPVSARRSAHLQSPLGVQEKEAAAARRTKAAEKRQADLADALDAGEFDHVAVTFTNARQAGLCAPGIRSWLAKHFGSPDCPELRIGQIRTIDDQTDLVRAACERAARSHRN